MTEFDTCGDDFYRSSVEHEEKWVDIVVCAAETGTGGVHAHVIKEPAWS